MSEVTKKRRKPKKAQDDDDLDGFIDDWTKEAQRITAGVGMVPVEDEDIPDYPGEGHADPGMVGDPSKEWGPHGCPTESHPCWSKMCLSNDGTLLSPTEKRFNLELREERRGDIHKAKSPPPAEIPAVRGKVLIPPTKLDISKIEESKLTPEEVREIGELLSTKETTTYLDGRVVRRLYNDFLSMRSLQAALIEEQQNLLKENDRLRGEAPPF